MSIRLKLKDPSSEGTEGADIDAVVFDCDGVLLETISAKLQAYMDWIPAGLSGLKGVFSAHNRKSFGQSRAVQIRYFYEVLAGMTEVTEEFLEKEVARFTSVCEPLCETAPWAVGANEFVNVCREAGCRTAVLSGTPQAELEAMLVQRDAMGLFDLVMGFPITKEDGLEKVLNRYKVAAGKVLFVGDAQRDAEAALTVGTHFVYRPSEADRPLCPIANEAVDLRVLLH